MMNCANQLNIIKLSQYIYVAFIILIMIVPRMAWAVDDVFTVWVSGVPVIEDRTFTPCYPLKAEFDHDNPIVTRIRNEYPIDPEKFFMYHIDDKPHLTFHEDNMKKDLYPYMDWVAEDLNGNEYGRIRMKFVPPKDQSKNKCKAFTS